MIMPLVTTPNQYSQFPTNMAHTRKKGRSNTCDTKDLPKIFDFKKALLFLLERKNINADVRNFHLGFTGKTPTINKQLELHYRTFLRIMAVNKYKYIITTTVTVRNLETVSDKF
jgi:hypothetical protein